MNRRKYKKLYQKPSVVVSLDIRKLSKYNAINILNEAVKYYNRQNKFNVLVVPSDENGVIVLPLTMDAIQTEKSQKQFEQIKQEVNRLIQSSNESI